MSFTFYFPFIFVFILSGFFYTWDTHMKCDTWLILYIIYYFWNCIYASNLHRRGSHWWYSKYGPHSFLAYVANHLYHLYATRYSSCRLGFCSHMRTVISARVLCNRARLSRANLESGSSHLDRFLCHLLVRYEQVFIIWYQVAFHADMISDPVSC